MFNFILTCHVILVLNVFLVNGQISDKRLCANKDCTEPISLGKTLMRYGSPDLKILSFAPNEDVKIFSKSAGSRTDLWGVEIKGKRGYIPRTHVREYKIFTKNVTFLVDTQDSKPSTSQVPSAKEQIKEKPLPDPVQQPYEVVDGTTIFLNPEDAAITPSSTESPTQATATPHLDNTKHQQTETLKPVEEIVDEGVIPEAKENGKGPTDKPEPTKSVAPDNNVKATDENDDQGLKPDESLVNNVLSSISNWINEGSGAKNEEEEEEDGSDEEEDEEEEEGEDDDAEVDDERDEYEDDSEASKKQNTEQFKETNSEAKETDTKEGEMKSDAQQQVKLENDQQQIELKNILQQPKSEATPQVKSEDQQSKPEDIQQPSKLEETEKLPLEVNQIQNEKVEEKAATSDVDEKSKITENTNNFTGSESKNEEVASKPLNEEVKSENLNFQQHLHQPVSHGLPPVNVFSPDKLMGEAGIHSDYTTPEPNYEVPPPADLAVDDVTPNPLEAITPPPSTSFEEQSKQEIPADTGKNSGLTEVNSENEANKQVNEAQIQEPNDKIDSADTENKPHLTEVNIENEAIQEANDKIDTEEPQQEDDEQAKLLQPQEEITREQEKQIETTNTDDQNIDPVKINEGVKETDVSASEELKEQLKQPEDVNTSEASDDGVEEEKVEDPSNQQPLPIENLTEAPPDSPGIFSGIYSSVFGSSDSENSSDDVNKENLDVDVNQNINEDVKVDDTGTQEKVEEQIENKENAFTETNEQSARNILWGSSIRKELENKNGKHRHDFDTLLSKQPEDELSCSVDSSNADCPYQQEQLETQHSIIDEDNFINSIMELSPITYEVLLVLLITAVTVVIFLWGYLFIDKSRKEGPLIAKINELEKHYLVLVKENEIVTEKLAQAENESFEREDIVSSEIVRDLQNHLLEAQNSQSSLEEQVQTLEKELENSTEVGLELNRMLSEFLSSENGSETLVANIEQLQRQLVEQQGIINNYNENLSIKETENHELRLELDISNTKVTDLQGELNKMALNLLKTEEDKEQSQSSYEAEIVSLKEQIEANSTSFKIELAKLSEQHRNLKEKYDETQRVLDLKTNEYTLLKENIKEIEKLKNNSETLKSLFDVSSTKAELLQLRKEKQLLTEHLQQENNTRCALEKQTQVTLQDMQNLKVKYDEADREKVEAETKLQVLANYFKEREAQLQKELSKQESMWIEKQGEATSTIERIKYMQEELQNYKAQNESLKQEIVAQEVQLKSQISVLEKRAHENWVAARQAERKLEDVKQESTQLRNRLTLRERNINDEKIQNRLQSPLEQNGELPVSPMHISNDTAVSPPLLYGTRDHLRTSPPLPGLPPFLPPPPGVPFMPPPLGGVHLPPPGFMPPPPSMIPGDHRPPPLGRMSSPPLNSRYSPETRAYTPYSRNSPSPTSDDDYDRMPLPPLYRGYSPYNRGDERRDYNRPPIRSNARNHKGGTHSSGSANSNESLEKINRHNSKV